MYYKSIVFGFSVVIVVIIIHQIPVYLLLQSFGVTEGIANILDKTILNLIVSLLALNEIKKRRLWKTAGLSFKIIKSPYLYIVLLFYLFIFTGGFSSIKLIPSHQLNSSLVLLFLIKSLTVGILEEVVFRGLIQGNIIKAFQTERNGVMISVILSGLFIWCSAYNKHWARLYYVQ